MLAMVIFAIDKSSSVHQQAKFLRYVDGLRAMGKLIGGVHQCIGAWGGIIERSYMMNLADFDKYVRHSGFVDAQEAFLHVPGDTRQPCVLEYPSSGSREVIGPMRRVTKPSGHAWTYVEATETYFEV